MNCIALAPEHTDLSSRRLASGLRGDVLARLSQGGSVAIDLQRVESISESYADELFGMLAVGLGIDSFIKRVVILHANKHVLRVIAQALKERLEQETGNVARTQIQALVAAKHAQRAKPQKHC
jgi:hypothetical protein